MTQHIQFFGEAGACAKVLPFAKRKLASLKRLYRRRYWTWERPFNGGRISLERNGNIEYIRIWAGVTGYEFSTALTADGESFFWVDAVPPGSATPVLYTHFDQIKFSLVNLYPDPENPGQVHMEARTSRGARVNIVKDTLENQRDAFLHAKKWRELLAAGTEKIVPRLDWFQIPMPDAGGLTPEQADELAAQWRATGYPFCKRIISTGSMRSRHTDLSSRLQHYPLFERALLFDTSFPILHRVGGSQKVISLPMQHATPPPKVDSYIEDGTLQADLDPTASYCGSAALHEGGYILGGSIAAEDYQFGLWDSSRREYMEIDLSSARPAWITADDDKHAYSKWYWRGDGKRCISLQYQFTPQDANYPNLTVPADPALIVLPSAANTLEYGFVELEWTVTPNGSAAPDVVATHTIDTNGFAVRPLGIDYDLFDNRIRRTVVLEPWLGTPYFANYPGPTAESIRALLVYAHFCTVDDDGNISAPEFSIPMYHAPWLFAKYFETPPSFEREYEWEPENIFVDHYNYWSIDEYGLYAYLFNMNSDGELPPAASSPPFKADFGYDRLKSLFTAMDLRAQAAAIRTTVVDSASTEFDDLAYSGKRWRIWGEEAYRETVWVNPAGTVVTLATDPHAALVTSAGVATPPAGYVKFQPGNILWVPDVVDGVLHRIYKRIHPHYISVNSINENPFNDLMLERSDIFNGFRISPKKHFALHVQESSGYIGDGATNARRLIENEMCIDHIEWFHGLDEDENPIVTTGTHHDLYNAARETTFSFEGYRPFSISSNGIWVI